MCGRFFVVGESENELLARMIREADRRKAALTGEGGVSTGEVFPSSAVAALAVGKNGQIGAFPMLWGLKRPGGGIIINTRSETALEKPMFRASMLERRCLIPCSWYFEWETRDGQMDMLENDFAFQALNTEKKPKRSKMQKIRYAIRPKAPGITYLAGIYRYEQDSILPALSILTRDASPEIAFIHDRMPVIFSESKKNAWLSRENAPQQLLLSCETEMDFRAAVILAQSNSEERRGQPLTVH